MLIKKVMKSWIIQFSLFLFLLSLSIYIPVKAENLTEDLVLYLNFTTDGKDSSGHNLDFTINGSAQINNGYIGNGLLLPGNAGDKSEFRDTNDKIDNGINFTFCYWQKFNESTGTMTSRQIHKNLVYSLNLVSGGGVDDEIRLRVYNSTGQSLEITGGVRLYQDIFYFICGSYNATTISLYLNGTKIKTGSLLSPLDDSSYYLNLGIDEDNSTSPFNGTIDEFRFYNQSKPDSFIWALYANETAGYTIFNYSVSGCSPVYVNTTASAWVDYTSCFMNDTKLQNRSFIRYDTNNCGESNTTHWEYLNTSCDYCLNNELSICNEQIEGDINMLAIVVLYLGLMATSFYLIKHKALVAGFTILGASIGFDFYFIAYFYDTYIYSNLGTTFQGFFHWLWAFGLLMVALGKIILPLNIQFKQKE